jgi:YD repeat-containing protein
MSYDDFNLLNQTITPEGITSEITYNKLNKKVNERIILAQTGSVNTSYLYDILDNPIKVTTDLNKTRKNILVTKYDADSRVIETQN